MKRVSPARTIASPSGARPLVDELAGKIQAKIMSGDFVSGSWLRQETLATDFGVSRTPIREALRKLQASGLVEVVPHRGALVRRPTAQDIREAYLVRAELEGLAAALATSRILESQLDQLREAEDLFRRSVEDFVAAKRARKRVEGRPLADSEWVRANDLFHEVVQEAAGNERLRKTIADLHRSFPRKLTWSALSEDARLLDENVREHRRILEAIDKRDREEARVAMRDHILRAGELVAMWSDRIAAADGR
jgi:DNA-binding GntR family transcriptional regulator